ncbi:MAG: M23 family metallopeptidase, partial [Ruminiclostridium sp.]|nr:M23 family metallopeptidase [Ruminiclostridium sp.]
NYTARTDGKTLYIGYGNADLPDWANAKAFTDYAAEHHLTRTAPYSEYSKPADVQTATQTFTTPSSVSLKVNPNPILPNAEERGIWACAGFGFDPWLRQEHAGLDFAAATRDEIAAIADGVVTHAGEKGDFGQCVILDHGNGMLSIYAHCSNLYVTEGETVETGTIIAAVGSTGYSTGPHLHFEIRQNDVPIDPTPYLNGEAEIIPDLTMLSDEQSMYTDATGLGEVHFTADAN